MTRTLPTMSEVELPQPVAMARGGPEATAHLLTNALPPGEHPLFSAAQVRQAVLEERERCIRACEAQYEPYNDNYHDWAVQQCVDAIRSIGKGERG